MWLHGNALGCLLFAHTVAKVALVPDFLEVAQMVMAASQRATSLYLQIRRRTFGLRFSVEAVLRQL